jgi:hypothetical protein
LAKKDIDESRYLLAVQYGYGLGVEKDLAFGYLREEGELFIKPSSIREDKWPEFFHMAGVLFRALGDREAADRYLEIAKDHRTRVSAFVCLFVFFWFV